MKTSGENIAAILMDLPPQPWSTADLLQILSRVELAGYERGCGAPHAEQSQVLHDSVFLRRQAG